MEIPAAPTSALDPFGDEFLADPYGSMVFNGFGPRNRHFEAAMAKGEAVREWIMSCTRDRREGGRPRPRHLHEKDEHERQR